MNTSTDKLSVALGILKASCGKPNRLPILSCVKMSAKNNTLTMEASDLDRHQQERIECSGNLDLVCVRQDYLANSIGSAECRISKSDSGLDVAYGSSLTTLPVMDAGEFAIAPKISKSDKLGVSGIGLARAIQAVGWCASLDETRYILNSVHVLTTPKLLTVEATNGRNLARIEIPLISSVFDLVIPSDSVALMARALERPGAVVEVSENYVRISHDSGWAMFRRMDGMYPNTKQVIPLKSEMVAELELSEFLEIFRRCSLFCDSSKTTAAELNFSKTGLDVYFATTECRKKSTLPGDFADRKFRMDAHSLYGCLRNVSGPKIKILGSGGSTTPMMILESGDLKIYTTEVREGFVESNKNPKTT